MYRFILFSCFVLLCSCLDPIELKSPLTSKAILVINGKITKTKTFSKLRVVFVNSSTIDKPSSFVKVKVANVINEEQISKELIDNNDGTYDFFETPDFKFEFNKKYKIKIISNANDVYESTFMQLNAGTNIEKLSYEWYKPENDKRGVVRAKVKTNTTGIASSSIFNWEIIQSMKFTDQLWGAEPGKICYATSKVDLLKVALYDATNVPPNTSFEYNVSEKPIDSRFAEGYYFTIVQESIDAQTHAYYLARNALLIREGNIFESPPGTIPSNITCVNNPEQKVLGYFYATSQDTARIYIDPSDVGNPNRQCPMPPGEINPCPTRACCDCLTLKGSFLYKPHFWK